MKTTKTLHLHRDEVRDKLLPLLLGRVFHVTCLDALDRMLADGEIRSNVDGDLQSPFGSTNSFFRKRGCISVFDYRSASAEQIDESIGKCSPFRLPFCDNKLAFLFLSKVALNILIPWTRWKEEPALSDKIVPYVEAGHPGAISITSIEEVFQVTIDDPAGPLVEALERGRARNTTGRTQSSVLQTREGPPILRTPKGSS